MEELPKMTTDTSLGLHMPVFPHSSCVHTHVPHTHENWKGGEKHNSLKVPEIY